MAVRLLATAALFAYASARDRSAYAFLTKWDAQWYRHIAEYGYGYIGHAGGRQRADYAFFPLFPMLERAVAVLMGLPFVAAGLLDTSTSNAAGGTASTAVSPSCAGLFAT